MKKQLIPILVLAALLVLSGCSAAAAGSGHGSTVSQSKTVDDVLREMAEAEGQQSPEAAPTEAPAATAVPGSADTPAPAPTPEPTESRAPIPAPTVNGTPDPSRLYAEDAIDVDVTKLRPSVIYTRVSQLATMPEYFMGQTVRLQGNAGIFPGDTHVYYTCLVPDALQCCSTGIEYVLQDGYPYPSEGQTITVTGVYETYEENGQTYPRLRDAVITFDDPQQ